MAANAGHPTPSMARSSAEMTNCKTSNSTNAKNRMFANIFNGLRIKSTNFGAMDQDQFEEFFSQCIEKIMTHFLPGVTEAELRNELLSFAA